MQRLDLRPCTAVAGDGPYPKAGRPYAPTSPEHACATAMLMLLEKGAITNPEQALALLAQTAHDGALDLRAAVNELNEKEIR